MNKKILVLTMCALFLFAGCSKANNDNKESKEAKINIKANQTEGLTYETYFTGNNELIIAVTNTSEGFIDHVGIGIATYDKKGNLLKVDNQFLRNIEKGKKGFIKASLVEFGTENDKNLPAKVEIVLNKAVYESKTEEVYTDKISGTLDKTDDGKLSLTINNTSGETLSSLEAAVIFYKDSKPVDLFQVNEIDLGASKTEEVYIPMVINKDKTEYITYDKAEFVVNNASKFNMSL